MTYVIRFMMLMMLLPAAVGANELVRIEQIPLANDRFNLEVHFTNAVQAPVVRRSENPWFTNSYCWGPTMNLLLVYNSLQTTRC
ncbi:hypothetical protein [Pseudidiomarina halophila]|uniref:hypothetical protein n=1 Tax=Pseudidiomarina halophila TaxID=1449799 RepID=UPI00360E8E45